MLIPLVDVLVDPRWHVGWTIDAGQERIEDSSSSSLVSPLGHPSPVRLTVGEVRGAEARMLLEEMNTGHRGTTAIIHASRGEASPPLAPLAIRTRNSVQEIQKVGGSCGVYRD
jgi:hypothetical protein